MSEISPTSNPVTASLKTNVAVNAVFEFAGTFWIVTVGRVAI